MTPEALKTLIAPLRAALQTVDLPQLRDLLSKLMTPDARIHMCHPFGDLAGPNALIDTCYAPLLQAVPDLERRDMIVMAGTTPEGADWVGCMGNYMGTFRAPFLGIRPTGHLVHMRFHEFYQIEDGRISELQAIWDIPEVMVQAGVWPLAPQMGAFLCTPAPQTGDGLHISGDGGAAMTHVIDMLTAMCRHPSDPDPKVMELDRYWHPQFNWYGPTGIGTARGISGFRHWHQIPFLSAMPDRKLDAMGDLMSHWIAEGGYVCETGWPNMRLTITNDGWMGIAPSGQEVTLRSLDFWRMEGGKIRENWVLVDLLDLYAQVGIDVFARLEAFNKSHSMAEIQISDGLTS